jgi:hypothetical protein
MKPFLTSRWKLGVAETNKELALSFCNPEVVQATLGK